MALDFVVADPMATSFWALTCGTAPRINNNRIRPAKKGLTSALLSFITIN
jgi:hypothetical protein